MTDALLMTIFSGLWGFLTLILAGVSSRIIKTIDGLSVAVGKLRMDVALIEQKLGMKHV